eukprot:2595592-Rhodomonas_salina.1
MAWRRSMVSAFWRAWFIILPAFAVFMFRRPELSMTCFCHRPRTRPASDPEAATQGQREAAMSDEERDVEDRARHGQVLRHATSSHAMASTLSSSSSPPLSCLNCHDADDDD